MKATLYEIAGPWKGRLAVAARPRGGDWLDDDILALRSDGVDILTSSLTTEEEVELGLVREADVARANGIEFVSFPIEDRGVPGTVSATAKLAHRLERALSDGKTVAVHCRSGIGRSSLLAASLLSIAGVAPDEAFARIEQSRGCAVPDTPEQRAWVSSFAREVLGAAKRAAS
jgi:protein-tyrosine phosphatase